MSDRMLVLGQNRKSHSLFPPRSTKPITAVLSAQGEFEEADSLYSRVIGILGAPVREDHSKYVAALNRRAELYKEEVRSDWLVPHLRREREPANGRSWCRGHAMPNEWRDVPETFTRYTPSNCCKLYALES